jgi:hypothetical protein
MLDHWLGRIPVVLEALSVHLEMTALVLESVEGETFETHHNNLGGGYILATVVQNLDFLGLHRWLVANCVSC